MINLTIYSKDGILIIFECQIGKGEGSFVNIRKFHIGELPNGTYKIEIKDARYMVVVSNHIQHQTICESFIRDTVALMLKESDISVKVY